MKDLNIPTPSEEEVERYLKIWENVDDYKLSENCLQNLFLNTYPLNNNLDEVLIKVCSLKSLYGLVIYSPIAVAKHIVSLKIDKRLLEKDLTVVNEIAKVKINGGRIINFYSFATKYCSHHQVLDYPIYDSYVDEVLWYFKRKGHFDFYREELKLYPSFNKILNEFRITLKLEKFDLRQIDKYLWLLGKEYFSKNYNKSNKKP